METIPPFLLLDRVSLTMEGVLDHKIGPQYLHWGGNIGLWRGYSHLVLAREMRDPQVI